MFKNNVSFVRSSKNLSIEARPFFASNDTLFLNIANFGKRDYTFTIDGSNVGNMSAVLEDRYLNIKQSINLAANAPYKFSINNDTASYTNDRFIITLGNLTRLKKMISLIIFSTSFTNAPIV